jgi:hypothetical protein
MREIERVLHGIYQCHLYLLMPVRTLHRTLYGHILASTVVSEPAIWSFVTTTLKLSTTLVGCMIHWGMYCPRRRSCSVLSHMAMAPCCDSLLWTGHSRRRRRPSPVTLDRSQRLGLLPSSLQVCMSSIARLYYGPSCTYFYYAAGGLACELYVIDARSCRAAGLSQRTHEYKRVPSPS